MSVAASVALAVAERVERAVGTRAGLAAYRALVDNAADDELRGRAILAALRCAVALRDAEAVAGLTAAWSSIERGVWDEAIATVCKALVRTSLIAEAVTLAGAEVARHPSARALYLHARCLELALDRAAPPVGAARTSSSTERDVLRVRTTDAFAAAASRAIQEGHAAIARAARVRRATHLACRWETLEAAIDEAKSVEPTGASAVEICALARVLLLSPSRFVRAGAIASLGGVIASVGAEDGSARAASVAFGALAIAAGHADAMGAALSPLELDRLLAMLGSGPIARVFPRAAGALRATAAIDSSRDDGALAAALAKSLDAEIGLASVHARARDIVRGRFEPSPLASGPSPREVPVVAAAWPMILDVAVALRDKAPARAALALRALGERASRGEPMPRQALGIAARVLSESTESPELRDAAVDFFAALLRRPSASAPPAGWLVLAPLFARADREDLADLARRAAAVAREPGAAAALALVLTRSAWQLAEQGERRAAIAKLREAKALTPPSPAIARS